jgi:OPA family sugar phosphate sensor protein UhpC-like MFS transporter
MASTQDRAEQQVKLLAAMYLGYGAMMVCRQMVTILSTAIREDETRSVWGFTNAEYRAFRRSIIKVGLVS